MVSHHSDKFGGHKLRGSGDMIFLVVEGRKSTCPCFNPLLLFISEGLGMPYSQTRNLRT